MKTKSALWRVLLGTSALTFALGSPVAFAQDSTSADTEGDDDVIVVTGIRGALESAAEIKRNSSTFVDSITASDVSSLPDLSVSEALGRIPGVTVSRFASGAGASPDFPSPEGRGNLIRGLGFVRSEFNGRDAFSANRGRSLDWSSIPPELVGAVDVYKNQSADLIEGGIGGTINLRTLEPFDRPGHIFAITGDSTYSDLREAWSPDFSAMAGNRWETSSGEWGILGAYSYSRLDSRIHGWQQSGPNPRRLSTAAAGAVTTPSWANPYAGQATPAPGSGATGSNRAGEFAGVPASDIAAMVSGWQLRTNDVDRERSSYYVAGQWQNDTMRATVKYTRVENNIDNVEHTLEWWPEHDSGANAMYSQLVLDPNWSSAGVPMCSGSGGFPANPGDCEQLIPIGAGLMESGYVSSMQDSWTGPVGINMTLLGIGGHEESLTEDISANFKWNLTDQLFLEFDAQHTSASAEVNQLWGGSQFFTNFWIQPDLDEPRVRMELAPNWTYNPGNTRATSDDGGTPLPHPTSTADPNGAYWIYAADQFQVGTGELDAFRADATYEFGGDSWFEAVRFGARYSERSQVNSEMGLNWGAIAPAWSGGYAVFGQMQSSPVEVVDFADFFRGGVVQGNNTQVLSIKRELLTDYTAFRQFILDEPTLGTNHPWAPRGNLDGTPNFNPQDTSSITEQTQNFYARLDFGQEFGNGMSIQGNIGARYVKTDITSDGFISFRPWNADTQEPCPDPDRVCDPVDADPGTPGVQPHPIGDEAEDHDDQRDFLPGALAYTLQAPVPLTVDRTDEHWLPSLNIKFNLNDDMLIRFGASQGLTRPNVQDLRASQEYVVTTNRINYPSYPVGTPPALQLDRGAADINLGDIRVNRGNPFLEPTTAVSYDLSFEWYFDGGFFSAAVFHKDLQDIISNGDMTLGTETLDGQTATVIYNGQVNQAEATIQGVELAYQQFFDFLPGWWSHFGVQANYTLIDASAEPPLNGVDSDGDGNPDDVTTVFRWGVDDLLGQSDQVGNLVGIYQDDRIEARLAYNWRSEYLTTYRDWVTGNPIVNEEAGFLDASFKYNFNERLQFRFSAANLLDTKSKANMIADTEGRSFPRFSFLNDRRFVFGFRYQY